MEITGKYTGHLKFIEKLQKLLTLFYIPVEILTHNTYLGSKIARIFGFCELNKEKIRKKISD